MVFNIPFLKQFLNKSTQKVLSFSQNKHNQQSVEQGRSMVEMLGVLMLMGLLAVGGVLTFRYVMNHHQASEVQRTVSEAKVLMESRQVRSLARLQKFVDKTILKSHQAKVEIQDAVIDDYTSHRIYKIVLNDIADNLQQAIYARKDNFAKMDIMVSPDETVEADQSKDSWVEAGMNETVHDIFEQSGVTAVQSSGTVAISFIRKVRVVNTEGSTPSAGLMPTECPADMPYNDVATGSCLRCNPEENAHWQESTQTCVFCVEPKVIWDDVTQNCECRFGFYGDSCEPCDSPKEWRENACQCPVGKHEKDGDCVQCLENSHCDSSNPICDTTSHLCKTCADTHGVSLSVWDTNSKQCVQCLVHSNCSGTTPVCNSTSHTCEACPSGTQWNGSDCRPLRTITLRNMHTTTTKTVIDGGQLSKPSASFNGFPFSHWSETPGGAAVTFPLKITGDKTLYAYYNVPNPSPQTADFSIYGGNKTVTTSYSDYNTYIQYQYDVYRGNGCAGGWRGCGYGEVFYNLNNAGSVGITCYQTYTFYGQTFSLTRTITGIKNGDGCTTGTITFKQHAVIHPY